MKLKTLALLVVLALLLGGWAWWRARQPFAPPPVAVGARVLPHFPINDVGKIVILSPGTNITLAKTQGLWTVATRFGYPAKFSKVVECLRELDELTVGQSLTVNEAQLGKLNLLAPPTNTAPDSAGASGTLLQLFDAHHQPLSSLVIGKPFMSQARGPVPGMGGYANGHYVRIGADKVFLVSRNLNRLTENAKYWLDEEFINVPSQDIVEMQVTGPDRAPITLRCGNKEGDPLALEGLGKEDGPADAGKVQQLAGALNYFGFDDVAPPTLAPGDVGLDRPIVVQARTRQGQVYTLRLGNTLTNDTFDRYAQVSVTYTAPAAGSATNAGAAATGSADAAPKKDETDAKTLAEKTRAMNDKLSPWIYVVKSYRAEPFLMKREDLIAKPAPPPDAVPTTPDKPAPPPAK